jgi:hypothetical protein
MWYFIATRCRISITKDGELIYWFYALPKLRCCAEINCPHAGILIATLLQA